MKFRYLKTLLPVASLALALSVTSCVGDLDVEPINPNLTQKFYQDEVFTKIYATMAMTGNEGPAGMGDVDGLDEGTSGFYRLIWNMSELATDEAICNWGDPGVPEMNFMRWGASHDQITGLYGRLNFDVTLCNHFLEQTEGISDEKSVKQRAEVRFMRALNYYYLLDFFGNVPFTEKVSITPPQQIKRADLYAYIESELKAIENDMYEPRTAPYGRADKAAVWFLLSRLYLNAEVYTGTVQWVNAATNANKVINTSYDLCDTYSELFMADNDENAEAMKEIILPIRCDGRYTRAYANSLFIVASTHTADMPSWGTTEGWGGNRARVALINKFFPSGIPGGIDDLSTVKDKRAMFWTKDRTLEIKTTTIFKEGLSVIKFSNNRSDKKPAYDTKWVDTDVPLFRLAEAYLTFAEATLRSGGAESAVLPLINELRTRAGATTLDHITIGGILDERARELYFECVRRTDLIRYGYYTSANYVWDWKGGDPKGTGVNGIYNLLPLPITDMNANSNLVQNPGYGS